MYTKEPLSPPWDPLPGRVFAQLSSTSDWLKERPSFTGEWIMALSQTGGRGRSDHTWISPVGGLYMSVKVPMCKRVLGWSLAMGVAVVEEIRNRGLAASLKWPNDIERDGLKLGGILGEVVDGGVVLGLGLNIGNAPWPAGSGHLSLASTEADLMGWAESIVSRLATISIWDEGRLEARWIELWHGRETDLSEGSAAFRGRITGVSLRSDEVSLTSAAGRAILRASQLREHWPSLQ